MLAALTTLATLGSLSGNYIATRIGEKHYEDSKVFDVFDVGYALVPQLNIPPIVMTLYSLAWVPALLSNPMASRVAVELGLRYVGIFALRTITTVVTVLPKDKSCDSSKLTWYEILNGACYDKVFSGHSAIAVLLSMTMVSIGAWSAWTGRLYTLGMALLLLVSRGHYTVDIVLGLAIGWLAFNVDMSVVAQSLN